MSFPRSTSWLLAGILMLGLAVRLLAAQWWQSRLPAERPFLFADSESYWYLGHAIAAGEPYQFGTSDARVFRTPGYPSLLAVLFLLFGAPPPLFAARLMSVLCGVGAIAAVFGLARVIFTPAAALLASFIVAIYPGAIVMSVVVLSEAPFCPLMVGQLALWASAWHARRPWQMAGLGLVGGLVAALATLMRPSWLLFTPFGLVVGCIDRRRSKHLLLSACMLLGLIVGMLPWWIRNWLVIGHFVPTTLQVGASLYDGLNPRATGASDMWFTGVYEPMERNRDSSEPLEYRLDRRLRREALSWAQAHPRRVAELAAQKLFRLWNVWPNEPQFRSWPLRGLVLATYVPLLLMSVAGAWYFRRVGLPALLCWLPALYITLLHVVFVSSVRYREPVMLPLAVLAAARIAASRTNSA